MCFCSWSKLGEEFGRGWCASDVLKSFIWAGIGGKGMEGCCCFIYLVVKVKIWLLEFGVQKQVSRALFLERVMARSMGF